MDDHDQRFKALIREFFEDFLKLFFREWAERFDFREVEWLDKELFANPPDGGRHIVDLIAKISLKEPIETNIHELISRLLCVVWIEIESRDATTQLKPRLPEYYMQLRKSFQLPVLPIVIYLKVGLEGIGHDTVEETFAGFTPLSFQYYYVGLPGLNAIEYLQSENPLGVALTALMKIPREQIPLFGAEALKKISEMSLKDQQRFLLGECVQAYLPLDEQSRIEYERIMMTDTYRGSIAMNRTFYEQAYDQGLLEGKNEGRLEGKAEGQKALLQLYQTKLLAELSNRFQQIPPDLEAKIRSLNPEELFELTLQLPHLNSLDDL